MPLQFMLFLVTFLGLIAAVMVGMTVSETMGMEEYIRLGIVFSPLMLVAALAMRRHWLGVSIGLIPFGLALPIKIIGSFGGNVIFGCIVFALVLGAYTFGHYRKPAFNNLPSLLYFISFVFVLSRLIYDRPGSAFLGDAGGGRQAFTFLFGFFAFWAFSKIGAESEWNPMRCLFLAFLIPCIDFVRKIAKIGLINGDVGSAMSNLYSRPSWILASLIIAFIIYKFAFGKGTLLLHQYLFLAVNAILGASAFAGNRSRPLFAMATIMTVAYVFNQQRKVIVYLGFASFLGLLVLFSVGREKIPVGFQRTISIFMPVSQEELLQQAREQGQKVNTELGWESEFRTNLYSLAWGKISSNPIFGAGFAFSTDDLVKLFSNFDENMDSRTMRLAMVGGYHNAILQLAVGAGLISAFCALSAMLILCWKIIALGRRQEDLKNRFFCAALAGIIPPFMGQMLMNGEAKDFFICSLLMGIVNGMQINPRFQVARSVGVVEEKKHDPLMDEHEHELPELVHARSSGSS